MPVRLPFKVVVPERGITAAFAELATAQEFARLHSIRKGMVEVTGARGLLSTFKTGQEIRPARRTP
jgi:hypothetical protein